MSRIRGLEDAAILYYERARSAILLNADYEELLPKIAQEIVEAGHAKGLKTVE